MIKENERIVAISDDTYIGHIAVPKGTNLKKLYKNHYYVWYLAQYNKKKNVMKRFDKWLIDNGYARRIRITVFDASWYTTH